MDFIVKNSRAIRRSVILLAALSILSVFGYVYEAERRFEMVSDVLSSRLSASTQTVSLLSQLSLEIGYGGFIHNFKNYVLRRDDLYYLRAQENYKNILALLDKLENHVQDREDAAILDDIKRTLGEYVANIDKMKKNITSIVEDDRRVKVDDTKAVAAIAYLYNMVQMLSEQTLNDAIIKQEDAHRFVRLGFFLVVFIALVAVLLLVLIKRLEAKTIQASSANEAKGRFLSTMSHEIRTPLNGMLGLVQLLNHKKFTKEEQHHLDLVQSSGEMLLDILNDVLDISKIEAHELRLEIISFDVEKLLQTTADFYKNIASEKGLIVNYHSDLPEGLYLNGDPTKIRQVLSNILANSVKFTEVGSINISTECEIINEPEADKVCLLRIRLTDTGIGMDTDGLNHLFEKFTQADSSISRKYGGTGLGMAIVKDLCELMNGTIEVDSVYGEGTSFKITLPMLLSSRDEIQHLQEPHQQEMTEIFQGLDVLVAEDNMVNAVVARGFLENLGINVRVAHDGAEAVKMFERQQPDIILMDVNMPIKDGIQATREIRQKENGKTLPILALTADAFSETREKCVEAGMNGAVPKPFSFDLLRNTLFETLKDKG